jgi:hypothetical protein
MIDDLCLKPRKHLPYRCSIDIVQMSESPAIDLSTHNISVDIHPKLKLKKLSLARSHYDQSSYFGRIRHFVEITDPRLVATITRKAVELLLNV